MLTGHGGNIHQMSRETGRRPSDFIDMSSNVNPLGPPQGLVDFLKEKMPGISALPEPDSRGAAACFARDAGLDPRRVLAGNGTSLFIHSAPLCLGIRNALIAGPTYSEYEYVCRLHGARVTFAHSRASEGFVPDLDRLADRARGTDAVFVCNPNNPTGALIPGEKIKALCRSLPDTRFVIDESYMAFADGESRHSVAGAGLDNAAVLISISKIFKIPGLRVGFVTAPPGMIRKFKDHLPPWSMNTLAQEAVSRLSETKKEMDAFIARTRLFLNREKETFRQRMEGIRGLALFPAAASFMLIQLPPGEKSGDVCHRLAADGILIRDCANFSGLGPGFVRVSFKDEAANLELARRLRDILTKGA
ncbi:conserved hypothetical protein [Candidatus Desulfarcum epimagneticum]|uniref:Aminotransferase class I/classII large domain-containing protein n=1 Tax=uncultured Desulfobacteraceae bacterium TaxID=218296 RepID=A0A484HJK8_9BACT|nr:conserved hypothetical protein [uncultured Desulfobacteraceae bacterium]